jgi:integrase
MASVTKRTWTNASGKATTAWRVSYTDASGKRVHVQKASKREAEAERIRIEGELSRGVHVADRDSVTVADAAVSFLADFNQLVTAGKRERSTYRAYDRHYRLHLTKADVSKIRLSKLTGPDCAEFARWLERNRTDDMAGRVLFFLRLVIDHARTKGWTNADPVAGVRIRAASERVEDDTVEIPPKSQLKALMVAAGSDSQSDAMVSLLMFCGLRASELRGLTRQDLLLQPSENTVTIRQRADQWQRIGPTKSAKSRRKIPVPPGAALKLKKWLLAAPNSKLGLVFPTGAGTVESYANIYNRIWCPLMKRAGLVDHEDRPLFALHTLRHVAVSLWIEQGVTPKQVSKWAGHASVQFTLDTYGHLWPNNETDTQIAMQVEKSITG